MVAGVVMVTKQQKGGYTNSRVAGKAPGNSKAKHCFVDGCGKPVVRKTVALFFATEYPLGAFRGERRLNDEEESW